MTNSQQRSANDSRARKERAAHAEAKILSDDLREAKVAHTKAIPTSCKNRERKIVRALDVRTFVFC